MDSGVTPELLKRAVLRPILKEPSLEQPVLSLLRGRRWPLSVRNFWMKRLTETHFHLASGLLWSPWEMT